MQLSCIPRVQAIDRPFYVLMCNSHVDSGLRALSVKQFRRKTKCVATGCPRSFAVDCTPISFVLYDRRQEPALYQGASSLMKYMHAIFFGEEFWREARLLRLPKRLGGKVRCLHIDVTNNHLIL